MVLGTTHNLFLKIHRKWNKYQSLDFWLNQKYQALLILWKKAKPDDICQKFKIWAPNMNAKKKKSFSPNLSVVVIQNHH